MATQQSTAVTAAAIAAATARSRNNNPTGRNQYSGGVMDLARDRPVAAAAAVAGAAAAGLFLWSKRTQISDQLSSLSDQIGEWTAGMSSSDESAVERGDDTGRPRPLEQSRHRARRAGGNASLGAEQRRCRHDLERKRPRPCAPGAAVG